MTLESLGPEEKQILFGNTVLPQGTGNSRNETHIDELKRKKKNYNWNHDMEGLVAETQARLGDSDCFAGTGEMAPRLRVLAALPEDKSTVVSTQVGRLTTPCNSSNFFWPHRISSHVLHTHARTYTHK